MTRRSRPQSKLIEPKNRKLNKEGTKTTEQESLKTKNKKPPKNSKYKKSLPLQKF